VAYGQQFEQITKDYGLHVGTIVNNNDPEKRGRVEIMIPGLLEPRAWADTIHPGTPFAVGMFAVPQVGSGVLIGFMQGDLSRPVVLGGFAPPVTSGGLRATVDSGDLPKLVTVENDEWVVTLGKDSSSAPFLAIGNRRGDPRVSVVFSQRTNMIEISGPVAVRVTSEAMVTIDAPMVIASGRLIQAGGGPI